MGEGVFQAASWAGAPASSFLLSFLFGSRFHFGWRLELPGRRVVLLASSLFFIGRGQHVADVVANRIGRPRRGGWHRWRRRSSCCLAARDHDFELQFADSQMITIGDRPLGRDPFAVEKRPGLAPQVA